MIRRSFIAALFAPFLQRLMPKRSRLTSIDMSSYMLNFYSVQRRMKLLGETITEEDFEFTPIQERIYFLGQDGIYSSLHGVNPPFVRISTGRPWPWEKES